MRERGLSFKEAANEAIRAGLARVDLTKVLRLSAELEDDALARRLAERR